MLNNPLELDKQMHTKRESRKRKGARCFNQASLNRHRSWFQKQNSAPSDNSSPAALGAELQRISQESSTFFSLNNHMHPTKGYLL